MREWNSSPASINSAWFTDRGPVEWSVGGGWTLTRREFEGDGRGGAEEEGDSFIISSYARFDSS